MAKSSSTERVNGPETFKTWGFHPAPMIDSMLDLQKQSLEYIAELNQSLMTRAQYESKLAADLVSKLVAARSIPEATSAWQECMQQQMQMNTDDVRRLLERNEQFMRVGAELFSDSGLNITT